MDPTLKVEPVVDRLQWPTSMAFLDSNDIFVLEKGKGTVERIYNGNIQTVPVLDANVSTKGSRGMLGIDVAKYDINGTTVPYVFLYYTESKNKDAEDEEEGIPPLGNRVYRYELVNGKLVNPKILLDLPSSPTKPETFELNNVGGKLILSNSTLYFTTGDLSGDISKVQNIQNGTQADGTSGILRVTQDGNVVGKGILGDTYPLRLYYAYGIRNSFGIDFDPVTGNLWDTENGPVGQFVTADLATTKRVCSVDIAWFNGNVRQYHFVISTSTDGDTFIQRFSGDSSGTTLNSTKYAFTPIDARFIRVTVNGNNVNTWASITELDVFGSSDPTSGCTTNLPVNNVTASGNDGNAPSNILDNNLGTRWASLGIDGTRWSGLGIDEINLVQPGFNSGWDKVMGKASFQKKFSDGDLVDFDGKGKYSDPEFVWNQTIGVTDLIFLNSDKLGKQYQNDLFVADDNYGNIYHFKLNGNRTGLLLNGSLQDKIANTRAETEGIIFAKGFGGITDLEIGPDGNLYVLSRIHGAIYRISNQGTPRTEVKPTTTDPDLKVEQVVGRDKLKSPSSMAFLDSNDILILNKDNGTVKRIINGSIQPESLFDANVAINSGRGMLGIDVAKYDINGTTVPYVFLYYTESKNKDAEDEEEGIPPLGNRVYRYELVNGKLVNPKLLLDLPSSPTEPHLDSLHTGGKVVIGPDENVYAVIGDIGGEGPGHKTLAQNVKNRTQADGTSGILRVTQDGNVVGKGILGDTYPLSLYYAYGIRNSFGIDFDPVTGNLWDTENGPEYGDEINLVEPGFNSGYKIINGFTSGFDRNSERSLVDFDGKGKYSDPEFVWNQTIGVTDLIFLNSDKLGKQYQNDLFVADFNFGNIYHFKLNGNRTGLLLNGSLQDKIANTRAETEGIIFAKGFGGITDLEIGPDGNLYVLSRIHGAIYRISHN